MNLKNNYYLGVAAFVCLAACTVFNVAVGVIAYNALSDKENVEVVSTDGVQSNNELQAVTAEFSKIQSTEDKKLIYTLFAGSSEYLKNCKSLQSTGQFDPILGKVQSSYAWDRGRYPDFTKAVSAYLLSVDYDTPKELTTETERLEFSKIFEALAEATKHE